MKNKLWYAIPILLSLAVATLMFYKSPSLTVFKTPSLVGQYFPSFSVPCVDLKQGSLTHENLKGRFTLLVFFTSWCKYCQAHLPLLKEIAKRPDLELVGISIKDDPLKLKKWLVKNSSFFEKIVSDPQGQLMTQLNIKGVPETFLVNPQGKIVFHYRGVLNSAQIQHGILERMTQAE